MRGSLLIIARNTSWLMADRLTRMVLGITVGAWVARHLGPESFGSLAYVLAYLALFQTASSLGLDMVLARELAQRDSASHLLLGSSLRLRLVTGAVGWVTACGLMAVLRPGDREALWLTALAGTALLFQPSDLIDFWFQSQSQSRRAALPRITSFLLVSGLRIGLVVSDGPLWLFAAVYFVEGLLAALFLSLSYRRYPTPQLWRWDFELAKSLLVSAWPLLLSSLSIIVYMRIDQLLLRSLSNERELGLYSAVLPFSQAWHFIPATICASATPLLVSLHATDPAKFRARIADLFALMFWTSFVVCAAMALAAQPLVDWLLGEEYRGSANILALHTVSNIPVFLGMAQARYLSILGNTHAILIQTLCGMIASIGLNLLLIPRYGAMGAAASAVGAYFVSAILCNAVLEPTLFAMQMKSWKRSYAKGN